MEEAKDKFKSEIDSGKKDAKIEKLNSNEKSKFDLYKWINIIFFTLVSYYWLYTYGSQRVSLHPIESIAILILYAAIVWLVLMMFNRKYATLKYKILMYVVLLGAGLLGGLYGVGAMLDAREVFRNQAIEMMQQNRPEDIIITANGEEGEIQKLEKAFWVDLKKVNLKYRNEANEIGIDTIFDYSKYSSDMDFSEIRETIKKSRGFQKEYFGEVQGLREEHVSKIKKISIIDARFVESYEEGFMSENYLENSEMIHDTYTQMIDYLDDNREVWYIEDGELLFTTDQDLENYENIFFRLESIFMQ